MIFRKSGRNRQNLEFIYQNSAIEVVNSFSYLGIVFSTGGSFQSTCETLSGQALEGIFKLKSYLVKFPCLTLFKSI
jgi:hypothetical protein